MLLGYSSSAATYHIVLHIFHSMLPLHGVVVVVVVTTMEDRWSCDRGNCNKE